MDENKRYRSRNAIVDDLKEVERTNDSLGKHLTVTVTQAILRGYHQQKTTMALEAILQSSDSLADLVDEIADRWDGEDFIAGALRAANLYARERFQ